MSQRTIAIRVDGGPTKHYTITNNKLSMKALQQYFRNACGLTYTKDDMEITVEIDFEGDYLKIDATVNAYTVCFATDYSGTVNLSKEQLKTYAEMKKAISSKTGAEIEDEKRKMSTPKIGKKIRDVSKIVSFGWKHKGETDDDFNHLKGNGTLEKRTLYLDTEYDLPYIIEFIEKLFRNHLNENYFILCEKKVGSLRTKKNKIIKFMKPETKFWDFVNQNCKDGNGRASVYLYTEYKVNKEATNKRNSRDLSIENVTSSKRLKSQSSEEKRDDILNFRVPQTYKIDTVKKQPGITTELLNLNDVMKKKILEAGGKNVHYCNNNQVHEQVSPNKTSNDSVLKEISNSKENYQKTGSFTCNTEFNKKEEAIKNQKQEKECHQESEFNVKKLPALKMQMIKEIPFDDLNVENYLIGSGSFGDVRKGNWAGTDVAVKTYKNEYFNPKAIAKEVAILRECSHENVVLIMGISFQELKSKFSLVMEYVDGHNLYEIIFVNKDLKLIYELSFKRKHIICQDICKAISFLHNCKKIVHRDLKPGNIIITLNCHVKVCDFGLSKLNTMLEDVSATTVDPNYRPGTLRYMAPEVYFSRDIDKEFLFSTDIWSLGYTLFEVHTETAVWDMKNKTLPPRKVIKSLKLEKLENKQKPQISQLPVFIQQKIEQCFDYEPKNRPNALDILAVYKSQEADTY